LIVSAAREREYIPWRSLRLKALRKYQPSRHRLILIAFSALQGIVALSLAAQAIPSTANEGVPQSLLAVPPRSWVVDATANELVALHHPGSYLRYRMHVLDQKGDRDRDTIETRDGAVARLILRDGKPLTDEQDKAERQRLTDMLASPSAFAKHVKNDSTGNKIADELMRLMPDAMIYTYVPGQPQTGKNNGALEIVLDYSPNPKFKPPTTTAEALTGLRGRIWIDAKTRHLTRMEGAIFEGINFGWGVLAHIYPGGKLVLEQADAGNGRWIFTHFIEDVSVRALMVKTMNIHENIDATAFQTMPGSISYQDAIHILLDTPLPER
jgi:hypothetical protein